LHNVKFNNILAVLIYKYKEFRGLGLSWYKSEPCALFLQM